jgi:hypothetical protein
VTATPETGEAVTLATHDRGLAINERYGFSLYDSMIVSSALMVGSKVLYSEDLQDGQMIDSRLRVANSFLPSGETNVGRRSSGPGANPAAKSGGRQRVDI